MNKLVCFVLSLAEISPVVPDKDFFYILKFFGLFCYYLPIEKDKALHLNKLESQSLEAALYPVGWNLPNSSGEDENVKSLPTERWTDRQTLDDR